MTKLEEEIEAYAQNLAAAALVSMPDATAATRALIHAAANVLISRLGPSAADVFEKMTEEVAAAMRIPGVMQGKLQ